MDRLALDRALCRFLAEDIGAGDVTSGAIFSPEFQGEARFVAGEDLVTAGIAGVAARVFSLLQPETKILAVVADSCRVRAGDTLLHVRAPVLDLLRAERVALNLAMRMCGIATLTARFVEAAGDLPVRIADTRKTAPGLRLFDKHAVAAGGGVNHRFDLGSGVLIKDNHIAACGSIAAAVARVRARAPHTLRIEVEAETLEQVEECLDAGVELILLDNMEPELLRRAVQLIDGRALVEASGGVRLENVREVAASGVDIISVGRLTHSAPAADISMRID